MARLWASRQDLPKKDIPWLKLWGEVATICSGVSYLDPLHEELMLQVRLADRAYRYRDPVVFQNIIQAMKALRCEYVKADSSNES